MSCTQSSGSASLLLVGIWHLSGPWVGSGWRNGKQGSGVTGAYTLA